MKRALVMLISIAFVAGGAALALDRKAGDVEAGKTMYRETCKSCHDGSQAKKLTPAHKTRAQWKRYLKDNAAKMNRKHGDEITAKLNLSEQDINNLWAFCYSGAMDSEKPQTCD